MNHREFDKKFGSVVREERRITNEILYMINRCSDSKNYLSLGYPSLFAWLVYGHGYSESAAYRRIEGARLLKAVPETAKKLESGEVSLTQIARVQSAVRAQEKAARIRVTVTEKIAALDAICGKSKLAAEQELVTLFPAVQADISRDRTTVVDEETVRLSFNVTKNVMDDLTRAKEILSHAIPSGSHGDVLARLLKEFLLRKDPLRKQLRACAEIVLQ
jgi:hypothetical protein